MAQAPLGAQGLDELLEREALVRVRPRRRTRATRAARRLTRPFLGVRIAL